MTRSRGQQGGEEEESQQSEAAREEQARQDNEYHIKKRKLRGGAGADAFAARLRSSIGTERQ